VGIQAGTLEDLAVNAQFWRGKRVLVTGHTGFKGGWLSLWLQKLGANVAGYSLPPPEGESLFELAHIGDRMKSVYGDIRNREALQELVDDFHPDIVFHLAAQPLVRKSYLEPVETYQVNVIGTVHVLDVIRRSSSCRVVVNITSDKCYENKEWTWGYRESDEMGGHDPYSSSKGCAELVTAAYRRSFFETHEPRRVAVASARAGNVIGGGDFSQDRIIPDFMCAIRAHRPLYVRNPNAVRPWQHVLEPLSGYLLLAQKLWDEPTRYANGWNFGPAPDDIKPVSWIVDRLGSHFKGRITWEIDRAPRPHEANLLVLDSAKARTLLGWQPRWSLEQALQAVASWNEAYERGDQMREVTLQQIASYEHAPPPDESLPIIWPEQFAASASPNH